VRQIIFILTLIFIFFSFSVNAEELLQKGIEQYRAENFEEALEIFNEAYKRKPSTLLSFYLGLTYKQTGEYKKAKQYFKEALTGIPKINDAYVEFIEVLYFLNELNEAILWIKEAEAQFIIPSKISFLKGMVLSKMGRYDEARKSFERAKFLDPSLAQSADLQIALTYSAEKRPKEAMKILESLIKIEPKTDIATFASEYLNILKTLYKEWGVILSLSYQYDDNVVSKPTEKIGIAAVDEITGKRDSAQLTTLRLSYKPIQSGALFFTGDLSTSTKTYFHSYKYDTILSSITLTPGYNFRRGFITLPLSYSYMWLNEREYMWLLSINPTLTLEVAKGHIGQFSVGYSKRDMLKYFTGFDPNEDRDGNLFGLSAGYFYFFNEGRGILYVRHDYSIDNTEGRNWDSQSRGVSLGAIYPFTEKLSFQIAGEYIWQKYKNIHTLSGTQVSGFPNKPSKRKDKIYSVTAGIIFDITKKLRANMGYYYLRADSNFAVYDYKRNIYTFELNFSF
jgi:tetratricopeptide (TPR) repeat protein